MDNKKMAAIAKTALVNLISTLKEDAVHYSKKSDLSLTTAHMLEELRPELLKMFAPPKPFKMPKLSKREARRLGIPTTSLIAVARPK